METSPELVWTGGRIFRFQSIQFASARKARSADYFTSFEILSTRTWLCLLPSAFCLPSSRRGQAEWCAARGNSSDVGWPTAYPTHTQGCIHLICFPSMRFFSPYFTIY